MLKVRSIQKLTANFASLCLRRNFLREEGGNFALMFAVFGTAAAIMFGVAISFTGLVSARNQINSSADAAVLAAVSGSTMQSGLTPSAQIAASTAVAQKFFAAGYMPKGVVVAPPTVNVTESSGIYAATLTYNAQYTLPFGGILGISTLPIQATVAATSSASGNSAPRYVDFYILVDASTSMGIGATLNDITTMQSTAGVGCSVACHADGTDTLAHNAGATLRFDVIKNAVLQITNSANNLNSTGQIVIRIGLYSFATGFKTLQDITSDIGNVTTAAQSMTLQGYDAGTNAAAALAALQQKINAGDPVIGNGSSASSPQVFAILATDAISNSVDNQTPTAWSISPAFVPFSPNAIPDSNDAQMDLEGLDPSLCSPIKASGVNMMTLETTYVISPLDLVTGSGVLRYNYINSTLLGSTTSNMTACATSPAFALTASAPQDIMNDMQQLFNTATQTEPRLTQ